jgi:glycine/D-amino acid oxidase-like deaminating enzyme
MSKIIDKADVVVIGGGAVGTSAAYHLAKRGKKVILCEMRNIASGASGRCGGMVVHCYGRDLNIEKTVYRLMFTNANTEIMKEYQKNFEIDFEFRQVGCLDIAISDEEFEQLKKLADLQHKLGDSEILLLDKKQTLAEMPNLNPGLVSGSRLRRSDGNLNPFLLSRSQAWEAQKLGAKIKTHAKVENIIIKNDNVQGVELEEGIIETEWVEIGRAHV